MLHRDPFRGHRFPKDVILLAVRWYCRYPLSYQDVRDLMAERGISIDAATRVPLGPEVRPRDSQTRLRSPSQLARPDLACG